MDGLFSRVLTNTGAAVLRIVVGAVFVAHGWRKVMAGFETVSGAFESYGIPAPLVTAILVAVVEIVAGLLLVIGLKTRWAVIPLGVTMLVAILGVHLQHGFFLPGGYEYALVLLAALVTLGLTGPGAVSVDRLLRKKPAAGPNTKKERGDQDATSQTIEREGSESA